MSQHASCPLCGSHSDPLMFIAEHWLLAEIAKEHPDWTAADGACRKCVDYYRSLDDAIQVVGQDSEGMADG